MVSAFVLLGLAAIALLPVWQNPEKKQLDEQLRKAAPGQFVELGHGKVHYQLTGPSEAPVVVLLNGYSVPFYVWERNVSQLVESGFQVLQYDFWGRGYSARPDTDYDRHLFVEQLDQLLSALKLDDKPVSLVGLSMGGAVTAAYASTHPNKVRKTVFLAPLHKPMQLKPLLWRGFGRWFAYAVVIPLFARAQVKSLVAQKEVKHWLTNYQIQRSIKGFRRALYSTFIHFMQDDPLSDFRLIQRAGINTLVLWGDKDKMFPVEESTRVREALGEGHLYKQIDGASHALQFEKAPEVNQALVKFLQS